MFTATRTLITPEHAQNGDLTPINPPASGRIRPAHKISTALPKGEIEIRAVFTDLSAYDTSAGRIRRDLIEIIEGEERVLDVTRRLQKNHEARRRANTHF